MKSQYLYKRDDTMVLVERHFSDEGCYLEIIKNCLSERVYNRLHSQKMCDHSCSNASVVSHEEDRE